MKYSKTEYERILNDSGTPPAERKSNGGAVPDRTRFYGLWMRKYQPARFEARYAKWRAEAKRAAIPEAVT